MIVRVGTIYTDVIQSTAIEMGELDSLLSFNDPDAFRDPSYRAGFWDGYTRFLHKKRGKEEYYFDTGLLSYLLKHFSSTIKVWDKVRSTPPQVTPRILFTKSMDGKYAFQLRSANESLQARRGILHLATNAGKTVIATAMIATTGMKTLFAVPSSFLQQQAVDTILEETPFSVGMLGGGEKTDSDVDIVVGIFKSLAIKAKEDKKWFKQFKMIFVDECHLGTSKTVEAVFKACTNATYRFGLSGTPLDSNEIRNMKLIGHLGPVISRITNQELIDLGVSARPIITIHEIKETSDKPVDMSWASHYTSHIVRNNFRNEKILDIIKKAVHHEKVTLILVHEDEHGHVLQDLLSQHGLEVAFCNGKSNTKARRKAISDLKAGRSKTLILSRIGEAGLDIPLLDVVVRATGWKSKTSVLQAIGRGLRGKEDRENVVHFHDFNDTLDKHTQKHSKLRIKTYKAEGFEVLDDSGNDWK